LFGALLILGLAALAAYRHYSMEAPIGWSPEPPAVDSSAVQRDSLGRWGQYWLCAGLGLDQGVQFTRKSAAKTWRYADLKEA